MFCLAGVHLLWWIDSDMILCLSLSPSTFGMVDSEETCCVVMVYNTADNWGVLIGDSVVIPEPQVKRHSVAHNDQVSVSFSTAYMDLYTLFTYNDCDVIVSTLAECTDFRCL